MTRDPSAIRWKGETLAFHDYTHFQNYYASYMSHAALLMSGNSLPVGTRRRFKIEIPGVAADIQLIATVVFRKHDQLGFSIEDFANLRPQLEKLARN